jgi:2-oxoglutarate dehydrogenase E2 component (dihydrolipoamide succinyltransferase)
LVEVSTDKVDTEIPSPAAGILQKIVAQEDETVAVGAELAVIGDGATSAPAESQTPQAATPEAATPKEATPKEATPEAAPEPAPVPPVTAATPVAPWERPAPAPDPDAPTGNTKGTDVTMPALGESVTEGTVTRWLKAVGESVAVDEALVEVSTDKVDTEIPSPVAGTLLEISAPEDATVEVGGKLGVIGVAGGALAAPAPAQTPAPAAEAPKPPAPPVPAAAPAPVPAVTTSTVVSTSATNGVANAALNDNAPYVTPLVRKLATENGIDLHTLQGTGVGGRIRKQDVLAAAEAAKAPKPTPVAAPAAPVARSAAPAADGSLRGTTGKMTRLRQTVSRRMVESLQTAAQLTQVIEVDVTRIAKLRAKSKTAFEQREGVKLTFLPFFAKATVEALKHHPKLNASISDDATEVTYHGVEHLGIAVDTDRGLLTPAIRDAGDLSISGLAHKIGDLAERTRANKVTPDELFGATFNLTNLGSMGALWDTPIIQLPQVGILGVGLVVKRPVVVTDENGDDTIAIRSMVYLALTYDHRLVDGADAGRFLATVKNRLEEGSFDGDLGL